MDSNAKVQLYTTYIVVRDAIYQKFVASNNNLNDQFKELLKNMPQSEAELKDAITALEALKEN